MPHLKLTASAGALACMIANSMPAFAQAEDTAGLKDSGEIIVTARRSEERLQDVPISITVYNQEALSKRNIVSSADLATYTPSLSVNARYGSERASFAIRGFVQDFNTEASVGVYFADVIAPRSGAGVTAGNGVGVGSLFDLQNVQVLKGPQGTLFGRNTTGGAVLLVPQRPTGDLEGYVEGSLGDYSLRRVQAVLNLPLADTFKVRLGVDRMKRDGYLKNHSGIGPDRMANMNYVSARLSILAELTPDLENYTIATYSDSDTYGSTLRVVGCLREPPANPFSILPYGHQYGCAQVDRQNARGDGWWDVENSHANPRQQSRTWQTINTTTWRASDNLTIKNIISYSELKGHSGMTLGGDSWLNPDGSLFVNVINVDDIKGFANGNQSTFTEELQLQGNTPDGRMTWQAGGYIEVSNPLSFASTASPLLLNCTDLDTFQCKEGLSLDFGAFKIPLSSHGQTLQKFWWRSKGLYAQGTYKLTDKLSVTAGMRYTWDSMRHYTSTTSVRYFSDNTPSASCANTVRVPGPGGIGTTKVVAPGDLFECGVEFADNWRKPTWVVDLEYKPNPDVMLFAKWSRGYRAGGVNAGFVFFESWEPEKVDTYEVGAKTSFNTGAIRGNFNITGFYNDFRNQQIQGILAAKTGAPVSGGTAVINAGKSRLWGIEVDTVVTLFDRFRIDAGYTYLNTRVLELSGLPPDDNTPFVPGGSPFSSIRPTGEEGKPLALSPKHRVQVTGTYTLPFDSSMGEISVGATFVHTAKQIANTATLPEFGTMPATNLLNLNVNWKDVMGQPIDLAFFMTNVTNNAFPVNSFNLYPNFGFEGQVTNEPRMWGFRLRYKFGS